MLRVWNTSWYAPILVFLTAVFWILVSAAVFTNLTAGKINKEIVPFLGNCEANRYISEIRALFKDKTKNRVTISIYNAFLASGYAVIGDYGSVYDCCQKITDKKNQIAKSLCMIDYYASEGLTGQAQAEIGKLQKKIGKMKDSGFKKNCEISIMNAEYAIRIKQGNYEGAEEHYKKMMETVKPLLPLGRASYSYALGKLLVLKGEPERAKGYLQTAYDIGGDTKYRKYAGEQLLKLTSVVSSESSEDRLS